MFLEHNISILAIFLKDHVTLKTGVMASKKGFAIIAIYIYVFSFNVKKNPFILITHSFINSITGL